MKAYIPTILIMALFALGIFAFGFMLGQAIEKNSQIIAEYINNPENIQIGDHVIWKGGDITGVVVGISGNRATVKVLGYETTIFGGNTGRRIFINQDFLLVELVKVKD